MIKPAVAILVFVLGVEAEAADAFAGSWLLDAKNSVFPSEAERIQKEERTYTPTADGVHVAWTFVDAKGNTKTGEYTAKCAERECRSPIVHWREVDARTVEGQTLEAGSPPNYTRTVSVDGKTMTLSFYRSDKNKPEIIEVFHRK
jgi:hypothetical protein